MEDMSFIEKYVSLIRDIINSITLKIEGPNFLSKAKKQLRLEKESYWALLTSSLDLIGDAELAKKHFYQFEIGGPTKYDDTGEKYLRLYGVLSSIYLQKSAIIQLCEVFKFNFKSQIRKGLNKLQIIKLRNIVASHTIDYLENGNKKTFMLARFSLGQKELVVNDEKNMFFNYNIIELMKEFDTKAIEVLDKINEKAINTIYKNNETEKKRLLAKLERIRNERNGHIYIDIDDNKQIVIVKNKTKE